MGAFSKLGLFGLFLGCFLASSIVPFSADALYVSALAVTQKPTACLAVATAGNWLGGIFTYWIGWIGKWEWLEKYLKVKDETLRKQKYYVDKYGVWLALLSWVPIVGDLFVVALGFYKTRPFWSIVFLFIGKFLRFLAWTYIIGLI